MSQERLVMIHGHTLSTQVGCSEQVNEADNGLRSILLDGRWQVDGFELRKCNEVDELIFNIGGPARRIF